MSKTTDSNSTTLKIDYSPALVKRFDEILARGLCNGVGERDGQMCIEAAICAVLDLPHGDDPQCVAPAVRRYKIALNDKRWSSPVARAKGLRDLGLAQIGSRGVVDDVEFAKRLAERTIRVLLPKLFRQLNKPRFAEAANRCEREGTTESAREARKVAAAAYAAAAYAADAAADAAAYAAAAAADAAYAAYAAAAAADAADAADAAAAYAAAYDTYLNLSASLALDVLRELKSPGVVLLGM